MDLTTLSPVQKQGSPNQQVSPLFGIPTQSVSDLVPDDINAIANSAPAQAQQSGQPKKHGAIHNILSTLGDFLLESTGIGDVIKKRRLNEAMQGFDQDPNGTITKVSGIDYAVGSKLRDQFIDNQRLAANNASTAEARSARLEQAQVAINDRTRNRAGALLGSMTQWTPDKRAANYPAMRDQVLKYGAANGLDLSSELPETYNPDVLDSFIDSAVPVGTQRTQRLTEIKNANTKELGEKRIATTVRGQDIVSSDKAASRAVTARGQDMSSARAAARSSGGGGGSARVKPIGRYVGDDGKYRVMMSDNTERTSSAAVRPQKGGAAKPAEGMRRVVNGHTYEWRGGKGVRVD